jgi:hypothetical protein
MSFRTADWGRWPNLHSLTFASMHQMTNRHEIIIISQLVFFILFYIWIEYFKRSTSETQWRLWPDILSRSKSKHARERDTLFLFFFLSVVEGKRNKITDKWCHV